MAKRRRDHSGRGAKAAMRPVRRTLVSLSCVALLSATCREQGNSSSPVPMKLEPQPVPTDLGRRAYDHVANLCGFGPRFTGSPGWRQSVDYIATMLREASGREPVRDRWRDEQFGVEFENIHVTFPGRRPGKVLIAAHHDTKKCEGHPNPKHNFHFVGANDSGSGVGLLLALATLLRDRDNEMTIELAFFDGEECLDYAWDDDKALFGSRRYAEREKARRERGEADVVRALVLLDMVGARDLQIDEETYSDPELREIIRAAAAATRNERYFYRTRMPVKDDHMPFLRAGIPAVDLIDMSDNPQWHTADDTLEHISAGSLHIVGEVVWTALPAIERFVAAREKD